MMTSQALIILIIHVFVLVLWMADSRAMDYVIQKFRYRRSMPQPVEENEENPFIIDRTKEAEEKEAVDAKFREMITTAYKNVPGRWDVWGPEESSKKTENFYKTDRPLEPLFDSLMEELEKTEPEIYKFILKKHFFRQQRRRHQKDEE